MSNIINGEYCEVYLGWWLIVSVPCMYAHIGDREKPGAGKQSPTQALAKPGRHW